MRKTIKDRTEVSFGAHKCFGSTHSLYLGQNYTSDTEHCEDFVNCQNYVLGSLGTLFIDELFWPACIFRKIFLHYLTRIFLWIYMLYSVNIKDK
ncbi:unnamed protein product, partial [Ceratitis capitata]